MREEKDPIGRFEEENRRYTAATLRIYISAFRCLERWLREKSGTPILSCTPEQIEAYLSEGQARGWRVFTLNSYLKMFRVFFGWCVKQGLIESSPAAGIGKREGGPVESERHLPLEAIERLFTYTGALARTLSAREKQIHCIFSLIYYARVRPGQLLALRLGDVVEADGQFYVCVAGGQRRRKKNGSSSRRCLPGL